MAAADAALATGLEPRKRKRVQLTPVVAGGAVVASHGTDPPVAEPPRGPATPVVAGTSPSCLPKAAPPPEAPPAGPAEVGVAEIPAEGGWACDSTGLWEVRVRGGRSCPEIAGGSSSLVQGLRRTSTSKAGQATPLWEYPVHARVLRLAVDGGFAAVAMEGRELQVLSLDSGRPVFPPILLGARPIYLELSARGHLVTLLSDGSITVWDVPKAACSVQCSLRGVCAPGDLQRLGVRPATGEPCLVLKDMRLLHFHRALQRWVVVASRSGGPLEPSELAGSTPSLVGTRAAGSASGEASAEAEGPRLEGDLLAAACLGSPEEFKERLAALTRHCAVAGEGGRLRGCCASMRGSLTAASGPWPWLAAELAGMDLDGRSLVREVVLPALTSKGSRGEELFAEIEEVFACAEPDLF